MGKGTEKEPKTRRVKEELRKIRGKEGRVEERVRREKLGRDSGGITVIEWISNFNVYSLWLWYT